MTTTTQPLPPRVGAVGRARASAQALQTLAHIRSQARMVATDQEREVLAGWTGWGPLHKAFAPDDDTWVKISEQITAALPSDDLELGMQGTYNSFYTPEPIAEAMWTILERVGFTGGHVLEPGCGGGVFMRTAPDGVAVTGVERDPTSADICRLLNPQHRVLTGQLQQRRLRHSFAAVIGNVPFADMAVFDPNAPAAVTVSLHDYFLWRAVDALAPGGVAVLLTSRHSMDKAVQDARREIGRQADLVAAYRLPNGALGNGTDIVADILVLRKRTDVPGNGFGWFDVDRERFGWNNPVNRYWSESPLAVGGEMCNGATSQWGLGVEVKPLPGGPDPAVWLEDISRCLPGMAHARRLMWQPPVDVAAPPDTEGLVTEQGWHNGSIRLVEDTLFRVEDGQLATVQRPSKELKALVGLRDAAVLLIAREADHSIGDRLLDTSRAQLARLYQSYVRAFGALNRCTLIEGEVDEETGEPTYTRRTPPMGGFRKDPDAGLVWALEVFDDETQEARPAPILSTRQNLPVPRPQRAENAKQALAFCLNHHAGRVDLGYIAGLLRVDPARVPKMLGEDVYHDPGDRGWVTAEEYLSGNVRRKLAAATLAAATLPEFARNVAALERVQPRWLGPGEIGVNLGSPWISSADVASFVRETIGGDAKVMRVPATSQWEVEVSQWYRDSVAATADWGTYDVDAYQLISLALNQKVPVVHRTVKIDGNDCKRKDPDASMLANQKQQALKEKFEQWVWDDPVRTDRLVDFYNTHHNCLVARRFSGKHVTIDGLAPWFDPYAHQLDYVARAVATPASLCGHPVGAGKTASMAMTVMKLRQMALIRKGMLVVPNHLKDQIEREIRQLFPAAKVLAASAATIAVNRRAFNARVATQEWDIVLVTHSAFDRMGVSPQTEEAYVRQEKAELEDAILFASGQDTRSSRMVKQLAKRKDALEERLKELKSRAHGFDLGLTFESMGVDWIGLDEAHYYKNLAVPVSIDGFSIRPSKRATALEIKLRWLAQRGGGRYAALFTGTPVSNTMLELYVLLRYLMFDELREIGLGSATAWCQQYVQFVTSVDVTVDGGQFQMVTRPALFINAPELRMLLSQVADIRTAKQLGLKRPETLLEIILCQPTRAQVDYSAELVGRAESVKHRSFFDESKDNMLAICGDGRRMATDPALVGIGDTEPGKLDAVADNMIRVWREHKDVLQIGFCDVGTPNEKKGTQTYGRLRRRLIDRGMPAGQIRFIHDAARDGDKAALFSDCRSGGKVSVILGSTDKLGVGTNIQRRVKAMHHIDAPYRPSDVEQRDGRGERPGNMHKQVLVFRYVTARTFDAYMWQMLARKIGFISQVLSGQIDRTVEDISAEVVDIYAAIKAAAADQPLLQEQAKVTSDVKRLQALRRGHQSTVDRLKRDIADRSKRQRTAGIEAQSWESIDAAVGADLADLDETEAARLHEHAKVFMRYSPAATFAGVQVMARTWRTGLDGQMKSHPMLHIRGSGDVEPVELRAYAFWTAERLAGAFTQLLRDAGRNAVELRERIARWEAENERAQQSADRPFSEADKLTAALARLDQIVAELQAAALRSQEDQHAPAEALAAAAAEAAGTVRTIAMPTGEQTASEPRAEVQPQALVQALATTADQPIDTEEDDDELFGQLADDYDQFTRDVFAGLLAGSR